MVIMLVDLVSMLSLWNQTSKQMSRNRDMWDHACYSSYWHPKKGFSNPQPSHNATNMTTQGKSKGLSTEVPKTKPKPISSNPPIVKPDPSKIAQVTQPTTGSQKSPLETTKNPQQHTIINLTMTKFSKNSKYAPTANSSEVTNLVSSMFTQLLQNRIKLFSDSNQNISLITKATTFNPLLNSVMAFENEAMMECSLQSTSMENRVPNLKLSLVEIVKVNPPNKIKRSGTKSPNLKNRQKEQDLFLQY